MSAIDKLPVSKKFVEYLGDSVYAKYEDGDLILTTDNGLGPNSTIVLDSLTWVALLKFMARAQTP